MAIKRISEFTTIEELSSRSYIPVVEQGQNFKVSIDKLSSGLDKTALGIDKVNNTADADKPLSKAAIDALKLKADSVHKHTSADITDIATKYAPLTHAHAIADVTDLTKQLAAKSDTTHNHDITTLTGYKTAMDLKSDITHTHVAANITDFSDVVKAVLTKESITSATVVLGATEW